MGTMAVRTMRDILAGSDCGTTMRLILLGGIFVTGSATLTTDIKRLIEFLMGDRILVLVTVQAFHSVMNRVAQVVVKGRTMLTGFMAVATHRGIDRLIFLVCHGVNRYGQQHHRNSQYQRNDQNPCASGKLQTFKRR